MIRRAASVGARRGWWGGEPGACTESLGSETGDVGGGDDAELFIGQQLAATEGSAGPEAAEEEAEEAARGIAAAASPEKRRRLPPALPALCMRAERRGGRLILTELRGAERARRDVFRAERAGGRLRLRFADDPHRRGGEPEAAAGTDGVAGVGGSAAAAGQHSGGELCQVAAAGAAGRVEATPVMMGI